MLVECYRCQDFDLRVHAFSRLLPLSLTPLCRESREVQGALLSCKTASGDDVDVCSGRASRVYGLYYMRLFGALAPGGLSCIRIRVPRSLS